MLYSEAVLWFNLTMKILVFRIGAIGDVLLTTPAVAALRASFPGAEIHFMAGERAAQVLLNNPHITKVIPFRERFTRLPRLLRVLLMSNAIKNSILPNYDLFIDFESSYYSAYISVFVKAGKKIGFKITDRKRSYLNKLYNERIDYTLKDVYVIERYLSLCRAAGAHSVPVNRPVLVLSGPEKDNAALFLKQNGLEQTGTRICLCISGTWPTKKWPDIHWKKLVALIQKGLPEAKLIILWGPGDEKFLEKLLSSCSNIFAVPAMTIRQLASVVGTCSLLVSNDNGVRHIATALGVKTIGLFGPTNEKGWAFTDKDNAVLTADVHCRYCDRTRCDDVICMSGITPEKVFETLKFMLK